MGGNGWPEGSNFRGDSTKISVYEPSYGVNGNEYHAVFG